LKIKKILVSQPIPEDPKSPYFEIAEKNNLKIEFRQFIQIKGIEIKDFKKQKINILDYTGVIFTSRAAIDHFFLICDKMKIVMPEATKYFCTSESSAFYLQKYVVFRKRKIFYSSSGRIENMIDLIKKHKEENFLVPVSDVHKHEIPDLLNKIKVKYKKAYFYRTVSSDLRDINIYDYDILVFFSPFGIASLNKNFPDFKQNNIAIGAFGPVTAKAVKSAKLRLDFQAPVPKAPSMPVALELYIKQNLKQK
jgi:uroporphyrinogen-III synthase